MGLIRLMYRTLPLSRESVVLISVFLFGVTSDSQMTVRIVVLT